MSTYRTLRDALNPAGDVIQQAREDEREADALLEVVERRKEDRRISPKFACPNCGHTYSRVIESREVMTRQPNAAEGFRRLRKCASCGGKYATVERLESVWFNTPSKTA